MDESFEWNWVKIIKKHSLYITTTAADINGQTKKTKCGWEQV
jgi:hypothetical protein